MPVQCNYDINYLELLQTSEAKGICGIPRLPSQQPQAQGFPSHSLVCPAGCKYWRFHYPLKFDDPLELLEHRKAVYYDYSFIIKDISQGQSNEGILRVRF